MPPRREGRAALFPILLALSFLFFLVAAWLLGRLPLLLALAYAIASGIAFAVYAIDKSAARNGSNGRQRTRERSLHALAIAGGWPGALLAQTLLRHKSRKLRFQLMFWLTVTLNCAALAWFMLVGRAWLRHFI